MAVEERVLPDPSLLWGQADPNSAQVLAGTRHRFVEPPAQVVQQPVPVQQVVMQPVQRDIAAANNNYNPVNTYQYGQQTGIMPPINHAQPFTNLTHMVSPYTGQVFNLTGYPSRYPHMIFGDLFDTTAPYMNTILPWLQMGMQYAYGARGQGAGGGTGGGGTGSGRTGGGGVSKSTPRVTTPDASDITAVPVDNTGIIARSMNLADSVLNAPNEVAATNVVVPPAALDVSGVSNEQTLVPPPVLIPDTSEPKLPPTALSVAVADADRPFFGRPSSVSADLNKAAVSNVLTPLGVGIGVGTGALLGKELYNWLNASPTTRPTLVVPNVGGATGYGFQGTGIANAARATTPSTTGYGFQGTASSYTPPASQQAPTKIPTAAQTPQPLTGKDWIAQSRQIARANTTPVAPTQDWVNQSRQIAQGKTWADQSRQIAAGGANALRNVAGRARGVASHPYTQLGLAILAGGAGLLDFLAPQQAAAAESRFRQERLVKYAQLVNTPGVQTRADGGVLDTSTAIPRWLYPDGSEQSAW